MSCHLIKPTKLVIAKTIGCSHGGGGGGGPLCASNICTTRSKTIDHLYHCRPTYVGLNNIVDSLCSRKVIYL